MPAVKRKNTKRKSKKKKRKVRKPRLSFMRIRVKDYCKKCGETVELIRYVSGPSVECTICRFRYDTTDEDIFEIIRTVEWEECQL